MENQTELQNQLKKLQKDHELLCKMVTPKGFIEFYLEQLSKHETRSEAFHYCNDKYYDMVGVYRYSSVNTFNHICKKYYKK